MSRIGVVLETSGRTATLSTSKRGICEGCSQNSTCSFESVFSKHVEDKITVVNPINAKPGDIVEYDLTGHTELKVSMIVWAIPILGIVIGALLGTTFHNIVSLSKNIGTLLGAVTGFAISFFLVMKIEKQSGGNEKLTPRIIRTTAADACQGLPADFNRSPTVH